VDVLFELLCRGFGGGWPPPSEEGLPLFLEILKKAIAEALRSQKTQRA